VTALQVQAAARSYFDPQRMQIAAVGDPTHVAHLLKKRGAVEAFDADGKPIAVAAEVEGAGDRARGRVHRRDSLREKRSLGGGKFSVRLFGLRPFGVEDDVDVAAALRAGVIPVDAPPYAISEFQRSRMPNAFGRAGARQTQAKGWPDSRPARVDDLLA